MRKLLFGALCAVGLAGCQQTAQAPSTASGKPEVTIKATTASIKANLLSLAMDRRFNVTKDTEYLLQIEKPTDNLGAAILFGSKYDGVPSERIVFTFAALGDSVRVVASSMVVTNPGSSFERINPIDSGEGVNRTQATLDGLKATLETPAPQVTAAAPPPRGPRKPTAKPAPGT